MKYNLDPKFRLLYKSLEFESRFKTSGFGVAARRLSLDPQN